MTRPHSPTLKIWIFFALSWLHMLWEAFPFFNGAAAPADLYAYSFHLLIWFGYSALYLLPALVISLLIERWLPRWPRLLAVAAVVTSALSLLLIHIDHSIYDLYNFHINGFVINLLLTPGGIESLGSGTDSYISSALLTARIVLLQIALFAISGALAKRLRWPLPRIAIAAFVLAMLAGHLLYGIADLRGNGPVLETADNYPLFQRLRFRSLAAKLGVATRARGADIGAKVNTARLQYPLQEMRYEAPAKPLNIVWLVAESLRWDQLTPEIMPQSWQFAQRSQHFLNHYSSGNGTREGLFGMFYGLYGSYWDSFLRAGRSPLLMDRLQALNYQLDLRTSARFSYPEFDKTLFANVPRSQLHEEEFKEEPPQRDRDNTTALIDFIRKRDTTRPFMTFMFYESTHARYTFPDEAVIRRPYLESIDYTQMSRAKLKPYADQLFNRYSNAAHWVDTQLGRIYAFLDEEQLLDNTIVIFAGDHGEEFFEHDFWGHNSSFVDEQTRTPLLVWVPGMTAQSIDRTTSHMDIAVTLLQQLGAKNAVDDYALGRNLFDTAPRDFIVISDWHSIGVTTADFKYRIPYASRGIDNYRPSRRDDSAYPSRSDERAAIDANLGSINTAIRNINKFTK